MSRSNPSKFNEHREFAKKLEHEISAFVIQDNLIRQTWINNAKLELWWKLVLQAKEKPIDAAAPQPQPLPDNTTNTPEETKKIVIEDLLSQLEFTMRNLATETLEKFNAMTYTKPDGSPDTDIEGNNKPHIRTVITKTFEEKQALSLAVRLENIFKHCDPAALAQNIAKYQKNASVSMHGKISELANRLNAATSQKEINQLSIELSGLIRFAQETHKKTCEILKLDPIKTSPEQVSAAALRKKAEEKKQASVVANTKADAANVAAQKAAADAAAANEQVNNTQLAINALLENMSSQSGTDLQEGQAQLDTLKEQFMQKNSAAEMLNQAAEQQSIIAETAKTAADAAQKESTDASKSADLIASFHKGTNKVFDNLVNPTIQNVAKEAVEKMESFCNSMGTMVSKLKSEATKMAFDMEPGAEKTALTPKPFPTQG